MHKEAPLKSESMDYSCCAGCLSSRLGGGPSRKCFVCHLDVHMLCAAEQTFLTEDFRHVECMPPEGGDAGRRVELRENGSSRQRKKRRLASSDEEEGEEEVERGVRAGIVAPLCGYESSEARESSRQQKRICLWVSEDEEEHEEGDTQMRRAGVAPRRVEGGLRMDMQATSMAASDSDGVEVEGDSHAQPSAEHDSFYSMFRQPVYGAGKPPASRRPKQVRQLKAAKNCVR